MSSRRGKRMSLLDKMEHIAELEGLEDLVEDDEDDEMENSVLDTKVSVQSDQQPSRDGMVSEDEDDDDDEDEDEVTYTASDLGYEWQGGPDLGYGGQDLGYGSVDEDALGYGDEEQSQPSDTNENSSLSQAMRRVSGMRASTSGHSYSSAPEHYRDDQLVEGAQQRRSTFTGQPGLDGVFARRASARRSNINLGSVAAPPGKNYLNTFNGTEQSQPPSMGGSVLQKMKSRKFGSNARRSTNFKSRRGAGSTMSTMSAGSRCGRRRLRVSVSIWSQW